MHRPVEPEAATNRAESCNAAAEAPLSAEGPPAANEAPTTRSKNRILNEAAAAEARRIERVKRRAENSTALTLMIGLVASGEGCGTWVELEENGGACGRPWAEWEKESNARTKKRQTTRADIDRRLGQI